MTYGKDKKQSMKSPHILEKKTNFQCIKNPTFRFHKNFVTIDENKTYFPFE